LRPRLWPGFFYADAVIGVGIDVDAGADAGPPLGMAIRPIECVSMRGRRVRRKPIRTRLIRRFA